MQLFIVCDYTSHLISINSNNYLLYQAGNFLHAFRLPPPLLFMRGVWVCLPVYHLDKKSVPNLYGGTIGYWEAYEVEAEVYTLKRAELARYCCGRSTTDWAAITGPRDGSRLAGVRSRR